MGRHRPPLHRETGRPGQGQVILVRSADLQVLGAIDLPPG